MRGIECWITELTQKNKYLIREIMIRICQSLIFRNIFLALALLICSTVNAKQMPTMVGIMKTDPTFNPNVTVGTPSAFNMISVAGPTGSEADYNIRNTISLKYDLNTDTFFLNSTKVTVEVAIDLYDASNSPISSLTRTLSVTVNNRVGNPILGVSSVNLTDGYKVEVTITKIEINGILVSTLPRYVSVESEINLDRYYDFTGAGTVPAISALTPSDNDCDAIVDQVELTWSTPAAIPEEYQVEWFFVNNYSQNGSVYPTSYFRTDFKNKSTRITTTENSYKLSLLYPSGYLVFRVRAVGRDLLDPTKFIYGAWNLADRIRVDSVPNMQKYTVTGHEMAKNWQYSVTYAEEGKKKEVVSYFDGSLRNRQTVTRNNTDNNIIVGETIYDFQGRPAVNVLPAPLPPLTCTANAVNVIKYHKKFNVDDTNKVYSKNDFDLDAGSCAAGAAPMDTTSGASMYYSTNNPDKNGQQAYVPHAREYPFSQIEYTPDNTGRVRNQSGLGKDFRLGAGRQTRFLYGQPNQIQLDRLFGSEAGDASHYKKNITIDPNGQTSVTYLNQEGKTIATGLAGVPPTVGMSSTTRMDSLDYAAQNQAQFTIDFFNKNSAGVSNMNMLSPSKDQLAFSTQLLVPFRSVYDFRYTLNVPILSDACLKPGVCVSCIYDLELQVKDECGVNLIPTVSPFKEIKRVTGNVDTTNNTLTFNTNCTIPTLKDSGKVSLTLDPGVYTVNKILTVNSKARDYYVKKYTDSVYNSCVQTLYQFQAAELANIDFTDCNNDCASCLANLGSRDDYVSSGRGSAEQWDYLATKCNDPCRQKTLCQTTYEIMLSDVSPGGQYGRFDKVTFDAVNEPLSVYNTQNVLRPNNISGMTAHWRKPIIILNGNIYNMYLDENGVRTKIMVTRVGAGIYSPSVADTMLVFLDATSGQKYTYPENLRSLGDFVAIWKSSYAASLVTYHPEYAYYLSCKNHSIKFPGETLSSDDLDSLMYVTDNFAQAVTANFIVGSYLNPGAAILKLIPIWQSNVTLTDPFFTNANYNYGTTANSITGAKTTLSMPFNLQAEMNSKITNYYNGYSMPEIAAYMARIGNNFSTGAASGPGLEFGRNFYTTPPYPGANDSIRNKEWRIYKQLYFSEKQKLQWKRMNFYAQHSADALSNYYGGCNACIGNSAYDLIANGMISINGSGTPDPYPQSAFYDLSQPCGQASYNSYSSVVKRFYDPSNTGLNTSINSAASLQYQMTGQSAMAYHLQNFLSAVANRNFMNTMRLDTISEFNINLYTAVLGSTIYSVFTPIAWQPSFAGGVLTANLVNTTFGSTQCVITININGTSIPAISSIKAIKQLVSDPSGGSGAFLAVAEYVVGSSTLSANVSGNATCLNLKYPTIEKECKPNQFAYDMMNLFSYLKASGQILSTSAIQIPNDTTLNKFITPTIKSYFGGSNLVNYQFVAPNQLTIYENGATNDRIVFTYNVYPPSAASSIVSFSNFKNYADTNYFAMDGMNQSGGLAGIVLGNATFTTASSTRTLNLGSCKYPVEEACAKKEHTIRTDLEVLINYIVKTGLYSSGVNLFTLQQFTPLLKSYVSPTITASSSTYTMSSGSSPNFDTLTIKYTTTPPNANPCSFKFWHYANGSVHNFSSITSISGLTGWGSPDITGNYYKFKAVAVYTPGNVIDTIYGSSCWPFKVCQTCTPSASELTVITKTLSTAFDRVHNVPYNGSNNGLIDPWWEIIRTRATNSVGAYTGPSVNVSWPVYDIALSTSFPLWTGNYMNFNTTSASGSSLTALTYKTTFTLPNNLPAGATATLTFRVKADDAVKRIDVNGANYYSGLGGNAYNATPATATVNIAGLVAGTNTIEIEVVDMGLMVFGMAADIFLSYTDQAPCNSGPPDSTFTFPALNTYVNPCEKQLINLAYQNAASNYQQYINGITTTFADNYNKHCIGVLENFTYKYTDKEYHHTLYYYDQAGNLIKTIPPAGVEYLPITSYLDPLETQINSDRTNAKQTVFTNHRMASKYLYNSLNQLTYQSIPDHDNMNLCDGLNPQGLDTGLVVNAIHFVNANKGYLCGHIRRPSSINRGYVYTTNDGGNSWSRVYGVAPGDFQKVQYVTQNNAFAVSSFGMVFKTIDGGNTWDIITTLYTMSPRYTDVLTDLYFTGTWGVVGGIAKSGSSAIFYTTNGGGTFLPASMTGTVVGDTITSITYESVSGRLIASARNGIAGKLFTSLNNGVSWTQLSTAANHLRRVQYISNSLAYAVGDEGTLLRLSTPISGAPVFQLVPTGMTGKFIDVYFKNTTDGVAIIDSLLNKGKIFKTFDGGLTWEQLSANGMYFNSLKVYDLANHKLIAAGKNGVVMKVLLKTAPFGLANIITPNNKEVVYSDAYNGSNGLITLNVGKTAVITTCYDGQLSSPNWFSVNTASVGTDTGYVKSILLDSGSVAPAIKGIILSKTGKLYSFYRSYNAAAMIFRPCTNGVSGAIFTDISAGGQSFSTPIYAFDSISKKNYLISFSGATASGAVLGAAAMTQNINSIDVLDGGSAIMMVGASGHIEYHSGPPAPPTAFSYNNVSMATIPVAITKVKAISNNNFIAVGIDGSIWKHIGGVTNWYLRNSGTALRFNSIASDNNGNGKGLICGANGILYRLSGASAAQPTLSKVITNVTSDLTDLALQPSGPRAYITANDGNVLYMPNYLSSVISLATQATSGRLNGVTFKPVTSTSTVGVVVGANGLMANYFTSNAVVVNEFYSRGLISIHFTDANNGFVIDSNNVIRKTSDAGNTWSVILPTVGSPTLTKVFTMKNKDAILIGLNRYAYRTSGTALSPLSGTNTVPNPTHFYDINFNKAGTLGYIVGSSTRLIQINSSLGLSYLGNAVATTTPDFRTVHVFDDNSCIAAGTRGTIYYYKSGFYQQNNFAPPTNVSRNAVIFKDIYFHDMFTGYVVGSCGTAYRVSLNDSINNFALSINSLPWLPLCTSALYMNYSGYPQNRKLDFNAIGCPTRMFMMIGGADSNKVIAGFTPNRYARLLKEETGMFSSRFWYDKLGRMILSQNTKQFNKVNTVNPSVTQAFSYTLYDALGRIVEVGEKTENQSGLKFSSIFGSYVEQVYNNSSIDNSKFYSWLNGNGARRDVTKTYYDIQTFTPGGNSQDNIRKRVAAITFEDVYDGNDANFNHGTFYSYDIHGNVKTLWQENKLAGYGQELKQIDYEYDLVSGKVNKVIYSPGQLDQFIHRYFYDADNRITMVETSTDGLHYDLDAKYFYYKHGPLARIEYGKDHVQGQDFAYTLQGWIKGVNSNTLKKAKDMGSDGDLSIGGNPNGYFARDIMGYSLNYYNGDYDAIDFTKWNTASTRFEAYRNGSNLNSASYEQFNGNISSMVTTISQMDTTGTGDVNGTNPHPLANAYRYDQLQRLVSTRSYTNLDTLNNAWQNTGASPSLLYRNTFAYDANGNILKQVKRDSLGGLVDSLVYKYDVDVYGDKIRNRLYHVNDFVTTTPSSFGDIKDQGGFTSGTTINQSNNYSFDEIGNLIKDKAEKIDTIRWNVYGKIKAVVHKPGSGLDNLYFDYDASGNRIAKHIFTNAGALRYTTYYIRDAQGNVLSTYEKRPVMSVMTYKQKELHLYGSSRLGLAQQDLEMIGSMPSQDTSKYYLGLKRYELTNHLGNVLTVISDKKIAIADPGAPQLIDHYVADQLNATDYYAFGSPLYGRNFISSSYRYGFNGKEKDDEAKGSGNEYDYGMRTYDSRLGRFFSVDPLNKKFPYYTPYQFSGNMPICAIDLDGKEEYVVVRWYNPDNTFKAASTIKITNPDDRPFNRAGGVLYVKMTDNDANRAIFARMAASSNNNPPPNNFKRTALSTGLATFSGGSYNLNSDMASMEDGFRNGFEKSTGDAVTQRLLTSGNLNVVGDVKPIKQFIGFKHNSSSFSPNLDLDANGVDNAQEMDRIKNNLAQNPDYTATMTGGASAEGDPAANQTLSQNRINTVVRKLENSGVSSDRITPRAEGSTNLLSSDPSQNTKSSESINRNVRVSYDGPPR